MRLHDLTTPALVLDRGVLKRNIRAMASRSVELNVPLRPHMKTPKSVAVAELVLEEQCCGITVSTLQEAEYFFDAGIADIFYAVPLAPGNIPRVSRLLRSGARLRCLVDNLQAAEQIIEAAGRQRLSIPFLIEIDVDSHRTGIPRDAPGFLAIGRLLHQAAATELLGVMAYGGASYECEGVDEIGELAERFRLEMLRARDTLLAAGLPCAHLSFGSTPAVKFARSMEGMTELRCGIYIFEDLFQAGIGVCAIEDIALSVLTTVTSVQQHLNRLVIDAGGLALSKDRSTRGRSFDAGYGLACDAATAGVIPDLFVSNVSQELGLITTMSGGPIDFDQFPVGRKLRILPNHADMSAAAYEEYHVVDGRDEIIDVWSRTNRW